MNDTRLVWRAATGLRSAVPTSRVKPSMPILYSPSARALQDRFDTRRLADRLEEVKVHNRFTPADRELIERLDMFFLATVDATGQPTCSYKGGDPGFVTVVDDQTLVRQGIRSLLELSDDIRIVGEASDGAQAMEIIPQAKPDVVLSIDRDKDSVRADAVYSHPGFALTPVAANKSFIAMDGLYLLGFGPRTAAAARDLSVRLYPALADSGGAFTSALSATNCRQ